MTMYRGACALILMTLTAACSAESGADEDTSPSDEAAMNGDEGRGSSSAETFSAPLGTDASGVNVDNPANPTLSAERKVLAKLGLAGRFVVGIGNDATNLGDANAAEAYALPKKVDIHYNYLSNLDWPEWKQPEGAYVTVQAKAAMSRGIVPMFTLYQAAAWQENNLGAFNTDDFMKKYWRGVRVMFNRLAELNAPAIVHVEPDLWGYAQKQSNDPAGVPMKVGTLVPECKDLSADVAGFGKCIVRLSRKLSPKVVIGLSASSFGAFTNGKSDPAKIGKFMNAVGAQDADILVVETLDRDAGCFEKGVDPNCQRNGEFYWDESNVAHPNFHDHLAWAKSVRQTVNRPLLWWQMPLGVPSDDAGSASRYRDNRVRYTFAHPQEFVAAGGIGAVFGKGKANQTTLSTDGGQFKNALTKYLGAPALVP